MITVTFVRHGESEDNPKAIWAGWKDAPLSELGQRQAQAVGKAFSNTKITHIYASPLKRAHSTGLAIHSYQPEPKPPVTVSPHLREQHFGAAEGNQWLLRLPPGTTRKELYNQGIYPLITERTDKFPDGEVLKTSRGDVNKVFGTVFYLIELISALVRLDPESDKDVNYTGLLNTAWTRVQDDNHSEPVDPHNPPPLEVQVTHVNNHDHLKNVALTVVGAIEDESRQKHGHSWRWSEGRQCQGGELASL
ncbi:histidine phosphatase superfamily [Cyathus striatus]|nr:histidine phosphatase superfamily [Cyathus striatus]